jgi:hypothetical protein
MRQNRSRSLSAQGLRKVTILVPKDCGAHIRQFATNSTAGSMQDPFQPGSNGKLLARTPS